MIVDNHHKYVFVSIPKTGSISIQFSLGYGHDIPEPNDYHMSLQQILDTNKHAIDFFKFSFVRNPWARILSLYKDFTINRIYQYSAKVKHEKPLFGEFKDFTDFCLNIHTSPWMQDVFLRSQVDFLSYNNQINMSYIGRFENFIQDFHIICNKIGISPPLLKMNVGKYDNSDYRTYYNDDSKEAIRKLYQRDIEEFKYEF